MKPHYPWPQYRQPWSLVITATVDGSPRPDLADEERRRLHLNGLHEWTSAQISFEASTTEIAFEESDETAVAVLSIPSTNTRLAQPLDGREGTFAGSLTISPSQLRKVAELSILVLDRTTSRVVGSTDPWTVVGTSGAHPPTPGAPPFEWKWVDFLASDQQVVAQTRSISAGAYSVIDVTQEPKPIVYLDSGNRGLRTIIEMASPRQEKRRLQNIISSGIARDIVRAIFQSALDECTDSDEEVELPDNDLKVQVLSAVADEMNLAGGAEELAASLLRSTSVQERARRLTLVEAAIDSRVGHGMQVGSAADEVG